MQEIEENLQINIKLFGYYDDSGKARFPMYISKQNCERTVDLLCFKEHYIWIKDFSRFLSDLTKNHNKMYYCKRCFGRYTTEEHLQRHQRLCTREDYISTLHIMPDAGTKIIFNNWKYSTWAPFVIYADLESIISPIKAHKGETNLYQHHKACAASALLCSKIRKFDNQFCYFTKEDAVSQLFKQLIEWETRIIEYLQENRPMPPLKKEKIERHFKATVCCICHLESKPFDETIQT